MRLYARGSLALGRPREAVLEGLSRYFPDFTFETVVTLAGAYKVFAIKGNNSHLILNLK